MRKNVESFPASDGLNGENKTLSPEISVVICVKDGGRTIEELLRSLQKADIKEIVVVDGMSKDNTLDICRRYADKILSDEGKGLGYARQIGAEASSGELIAFIDADVKIGSNDIFKNLYIEMKENDWTAINPQMVDPRENKNIWEEAQDTYYMKTFNVEGEKRYLIGMLFLVRKDTVMKNPFDPVFTFGSEDTDFFHRLRIKGQKIGVSTQEAYHFHRSTFKDYAQQKIGYGVGEMNFIKKHHTYKNLTSPLYIFITGVFRSLSVKKPMHIVFYLLWALFLSIGMLKGFLMHMKYYVLKK